MLDYVESLWCSLDTSSTNRGAMITFGSEVKVQIPLQEYSQQEWYENIEKVRTDSTICCKCCTPTAEAFKAARLLLQDNPSPDVSGVEVIRIAFVITDGDP